MNIQMKPRTVTLGPTVVRGILFRYLGPHVLLLALCIAAAIMDEAWGWITISGGVMGAQGAFLVAKRFMRLGVTRIDDAMPPSTFPTSGRGVLLNPDALNEGARRAYENWESAIGVYFIAIGTLVASTLPFVLDRFLPLR